MRRPTFDLSHTKNIPIQNFFIVMVNTFVFMQKVFLLDFEWAMKLYIFSMAYYYKEHLHLFQQDLSSLGYISLVC